MDVIVRHAVISGHQGMVDIVIEKDRIASVQPKALDKGRREIDAGECSCCRACSICIFTPTSARRNRGEPVARNTTEAIEITNDFKRKYDPAEVAKQDLHVAL